MEKEHLIFGIRAIIEAIQAGKEVDKVFIQKEISGELMKDLMKVMKRANVNFSYVPVEKLNRLTPNNHQGAVASISPIGFIDLEHLVEATVASGKLPLFLILDQISDARNFGAIIRTAECTGVNGIIVQISSNYFGAIFSAAANRSLVTCLAYQVGVCFFNPYFPGE